MLLNDLLGDVLNRSFELLDTSTIKFYESAASSLRGIFEITRKNLSTLSRVE